MNVIIKSSWALDSKKTASLETALAPDAPHYSGMAEQARAHAEKVAERFGALLAHFVENGTMTLEKAVEISGNYFEDIQLESTKDALK